MRARGLSCNKCTVSIARLKGEQGWGCSLANRLDSPAAASGCGALLAQRFAWTCLGLFVAAMLSLLAVESSRPPAPAPSVHHGGGSQR